MTHNWFVRQAPVARYVFLLNAGCGLLRVAPVEVAPVFHRASRHRAANGAAVTQVGKLKHKRAPVRALLCGPYRPKSRSKNTQRRLVGRYTGVAHYLSTHWLRATPRAKPKGPSLRSGNTQRSWPLVRGPFWLAWVVHLWRGASVPPTPPRHHITPHHSAQAFVSQLKAPIYPTHPRFFARPR
jgi:hypothetical protein